MTKDEIQRKLIDGKLRRFLATSNGDTTVGRAGSCNRCGCCCTLGWICSDLRMAGGVASCSNYDGRSQQCKNFPMTPADLEDVLLNCGKPCGYSFPGGVR